MRPPPPHQNQVLCSDRVPRTPPQPNRLACSMRILQKTGMKDLPDSRAGFLSHQTKGNLVLSDKQLCLETRLTFPITTECCFADVWSKTGQIKLPSWRLPLGLVPYIKAKSWTTPGLESFNLRPEGFSCGTLWSELYPELDPDTSNDECVSSSNDF